MATVAYWYQLFVFFFFSSRRRHTRFDCDWSSDVCSSDLPGDVVVGLRSSGIHSNGLTLARDVLFRQAGFSPFQSVEPLTKSVGEELLTQIGRASCRERV